MDILFAPHIAFWWITVGLFGLCLGSFAGALIYRLPKNIRITGRQRSNCPKCKTALAGRDLIPVLSWIVQKGRCRYCANKISYDYLFAEIGTCALSLAFFGIYGLQIYTFFLILAAPLMVAIIVIDLRHMIIPDKLNAALAALGIMVLVVYGFFEPWHLTKAAMLSSVSGAFFFFVTAYLIALGAFAVLKKQALGGGDIKFFAVAGLWLGAAVLPVFMMLAGILGCIFGLGMKIAFKKDVFPFGPALITAFIVLICMQKTPILTLL